MSNVKLYNTLTGAKEEFTPLTSGEVRMYTCGPTVYNYAHIGNLRAYVFADVLRRTLEYNGYKVKQVMNVTDVGQLTSDEDDGDDKMVKGLRREGKPQTLEAMGELGEFYTDAFVQDLTALNIELPHEMPRASKHTKEDSELIQILLDKGVAYKIADGIYFDTSQFPSYGTRGGFKLGDLREGARVAVNTEKKTPRDFALWKFSSGPIGWESPLGRGFPGWHIECSAMSRKYLGQPFDIHTGGIDHIPVHHQNEIAQSEAAYGVPLANYWMHNAYLTTMGDKMAKSGENFLTLKTVTNENVSPLAYRYFLLSARYSTPLTYEGTPLAQDKALRELRRRICALPKGGGVNAGYREKFLEAINDDLNTSAGLGVLFGLYDDKNISAEEKRATILDFDRVLGLELGNENLLSSQQPMPAEIAVLADARGKARAAKDWKKADELRAEIEKKGFRVNDTETGSSIEPLSR